MREQIDISHGSLDNGFEVAAECITLAQIVKLETEGQDKNILSVCSVVKCFAVQIQTFKDLL